MPFILCFGIRLKNLVFVNFDSFHVIAVLLWNIETTGLSLWRELRLGYEEMRSSCTLKVGLGSELLNLVDWHYLEKQLIDLVPQRLYKIVSI